ncbi:MAG: nucleoside triphosphate pyrophosphohydrolase [Coriobacteriales bacterium]|jgi:tetrapyrrole methylase family protein/MazG family protein
MAEACNHVPVPPEGHTPGERFERFVKIIAALRGPGGCPWDQEQTHLSISRNFIEEAYEALEAIESGDADAMTEELGDVVLEVVLQAQIAADEGEFTIDDVLDGIAAKMIRRHPHVFGDEASFAAAELSEDEIAQIEAVRTPGDVQFLWDYIKKREKAAKAQAACDKARAEGREEPVPSLLDSVPSTMPALMQAQDISRKAVAHGFEWDTRDDVWAKFEEERGEYEDAIASGASREERELELGDMLFTLVNVARKDGLDAEMALRRTCEKFRVRWSSMERAAAAQDKTVDDFDIDGLEELWQQAKRR